MKTTIKLIVALALVFSFTSCKKDETEELDVIYTIVNNGTGGVNTANDTDDFAPLDVAQAIPSVSGVEYASSMPIILFFNDKIVLNSIQDNFVITENGEKVGGLISINEGANGFAILTFIPNKKFANNAAIKLTLKTGMTDDAGNGFSEDFVIDYTSSYSVVSDFDSNGDFESGDDGVVFIGDGNILTGPQGCVDPYEGSSFAGITSGNQLISGGNAIGGATSSMILGPINTTVSTLNFKYNFLSSEFQEYVDSMYDDSVIITVVGENGASSEFLTSVNTVNTDGNTECFYFPGLPDYGDSYAGATGWISKSINVGSLEGPVYIVFTITDVADTIYSSALTVDAITY